MFRSTLVPVRRAAASRLVGIAGVAALSVLSLLVYGPGHLGYDAFYALEWGDDLAAAGLPEFEREIAPTPHPLANVVSAAVSVLGDGAVPALTLLGTIAFAALIWAGFRLGEVLFGWPVGVVFALVLATREELLLEHLFTYVDVPYVALVLGAAVSRPDRLGGACRSSRS